MEHSLDEAAWLKAKTLPEHLEQLWRHWDTVVPWLAESGVLKCPAEEYRRRARGEVDALKAIFEGRSDRTRLPELLQRARSTWGDICVELNRNPKHSAGRGDWGWRGKLLMRDICAFDKHGAFTADAAALPKRSRKLQFENFEEIELDLEDTALVDNLLDQGAMSVMYGDSNIGKTFVAADIGYHVAADKPWHGRGVKQGGVIYIAAEGGKKIKNRFVALRKHYGADEVPLKLVRCPIDLSGAGADVPELIDLIEDAVAEMDCDVRLIVIDTLSRAMAGADENAPKDMTAFVRNIDRIRSATSAHVMIIHHTGKDAAKGARGHSSLRAATDTEIEITKRVISVTKQRDMEACGPIGFDFQSVVIGKNQQGLVSSCVVVPRVISEREMRVEPLKPGSRAARALDILRTVIAKEGEPAPALLELPEGTKVVRIEKWRVACSAKKLSESGTSQAERKAFSVSRETLRAGHIDEHHDFVWLQ